MKPSTEGRADIKEAWAVWGGQGDMHRYIQGLLRKAHQRKQGLIMSGTVSEWAAGRDGR